MTRADARVIFAGLIPEGFDARRLTRAGKAEVTAAINKILELTGATNDTVLASDRPAASLRGGDTAR